MRGRVAFVVLVLALLAGGVALERGRPAAAPPATTPDHARSVPLAAGPEALGSAWFCAAGSSDAEGPVDHTVVIANPTEADRTVVLTAFPGTAEPIETEVAVAAATIERIHLADLVEAPAVSAMVEVVAGEVVVSHELSGPLGRDVAPCASTTSDRWYFAWGDTQADARSLVALFNPFPGDAVVDFEFVTIDGTRRPGRLTGVVVPGRSVVVADVGAEIARRDQVSATVTARSGRVVAERIQTFDDSEETLEGAIPRRGLAVDLGTPVVMPTWIYPEVRFAEGLGERVVVFNPSDATAEVDVEILLADTGIGRVEPFELTVRAGAYEVIDLSAESRITDLLGDGPIGATMVVRALGEVGVVAERITTVGTDAEGPGVTASSGTPLGGRLLTVVDARPSATEGVFLTLVNPDGNSLVTGTIRVLSRGVSRPLDDFSSFELPAAGRVTVDLNDRVSGAGTSIVVIEAGHPIVAGVTARSIDRADRLTVDAISRIDLAAPLP